MRTQKPLLALLTRGMLSALLLVGAMSTVGAVERGSYSLEILVDGVPLDEISARRTTYIEALRGREYEIRLRNRTSERIAVALSVDGLNTIDAKSTTARNASKWILGPYESITLEGWQTGVSTARKFFFTTEEKSYGAWLGRTENLGLISAAVFRERRPAPIHRPLREERKRSKSGRLQKRSEAPAAPGDAAAESEGLAPELDDDLAATGIGREVDHRVRRVRFEAESNPAAVLELRYEYRDALVRLGVLPRRFAHRDDPLERRERARGFEDMEFAPDPYR